MPREWTIGDDRPITANDFVHGHPDGITDPENLAIFKSGQFMLTDGTSRSAGFLIVRTDNTLSGFVVPLQAELGTAIGFSDDGTFDQSDGAIKLTAGAVDVLGSLFRIAKLKGAASRTRSVKVDQDGTLYPVDDPPPSWTLTDTDTASYDLGTGTGVGPWVELTGLFVGITAVEETATGNRLELFTRVYVENKTGNRSGTIEIGFSINGVDPVGPGVPHNISGGFAGYVTSNQVTASVTLTDGDTVNVFGRITSGSQAAFGVDLVGTPNNHTMALTDPQPSVVARILSINSLGLPPNFLAVQRVAFGALSIEENSTALTISGVSTDWSNKVQVEFDTAGEAIDCVPDHSNDHIEITTEGYYAMFANISFTGGSNGSYAFTFFKNSGATQIKPVQCERSTGTGTDAGSCSISAPAFFESGDTAELYAQKQNAPAQDLTVTSCSFWMHRLS